MTPVLSGAAFFTMHSRISSRFWLFCLGVCVCTHVCVFCLSIQCKVGRMKDDGATKLDDLILTLYMIKKIMGSVMHKTQATLKCQRHNVRVIAKLDN